MLAIIWRAFGLLCVAAVLVVAGMVLAIQYADHSECEMKIASAASIAYADGYCEQFADTRGYYEWMSYESRGRFVDCLLDSLRAVEPIYRAMSVDLPGGGLFTCKIDGSWLYQRPPVGHLTLVDTVWLERTENFRWLPHIHPDTNWFYRDDWDDSSWYIEATIVPWNAQDGWPR